MPRKKSGRPGMKRSAEQISAANAGGATSGSPTPGSSDGSADLDQWTPQQVCEFLRERGFEEEAGLFLKEEISGKLLGKLTEEHFEKNLKIRTLGRRLDIQKEFDDLKRSQTESKARVGKSFFKVFNDPIHGHIEIHPLCIKIIDTPQFQRLRYIKQLGCSYLVFPGAAHNRFEHSLGVCHLAGKLCRALKDRQPDLGISEKDVLCVEIAGACHDLGHGPFSHMFDNLFIPNVLPDTEWKHEKASVDMFDYLIEANQLKEVFAEYGLTDEDIIFIKEQIEGPRDQKKKSWPYKGRPKDMSFLYEMVANKRNGIDVDKWDYFLRDCHNLGISCSFDCHRFMKFSRVISVDGERQICAREKETGNLYDMFYTRNSLHRRAYQHKVNKIIESMIVEALVKADDHLKFKGKNGAMLKMSEAIDDMVAYSQLTDDVIFQIMRSDDPALAESRRILEMVQTRKLYTCIGQAQPPTDHFVQKGEEAAIKDTIVGFQYELPDCEQLADGQLTADQLIIHIVDLNYGMGKKNPIDNVRFYSKENTEQAVVVRKSEVSQMLPECFAEQQVRLYCKNRDSAVHSVAFKCFQKWCESKKYQVPKNTNVLYPEMTPWKTGETEYRTPQKKSRTRLSL